MPERLRIKLKLRNNLNVEPKTKKPFEKTLSVKKQLNKQKFQLSRLHKMRTAEMMEEGQGGRKR